MSSWIQTFSGKKFYPLNPKARDVCIEDIAHALAFKCRWNGHCSEFYSVAQHSVLLSYFCEQHSKWALMHDAAEAYLPDMPGPIKKELSDYCEAEDRILEVIADVFELSLPIPKDVHQADKSIRKNEYNCLMKPLGAMDHIDPIRIQIIPWSARISNNIFIYRFNELFEKHEELAYV